MIIKVTTTYGFREHHAISECWCEPHLVDCECGGLWVHHDVRTGREDVVPRMTVFSSH